jgi:hypothetical protein
MKFYHHGKENTTCENYGKPNSMTSNFTVTVHTKWTTASVISWFIFASTMTQVPFWMLALINIYKIRNTVIKSSLGKINK